MTMTLIFTDGFEAGLFSSPQPKWTSDEFGGDEVGRFGEDVAWSIGGTANVPSKTLPVNAQGLHFGLGIRKSIITTGGNVIRLFDTATLHVAIAILATGQIQVLRSTTVLATSAADKVLSPATWCHLECRIWIDDAAGRIILNINGEEWINYTGDTRNGGNASVNTFTLQNASNSGSIWLDDLYIYQITDVANDPWIGDVRIFTKFPNGAGNSAQWTPNTGANYAAVDESGDDDADTTYNASSTANHIDSFAFADISGSGTVKAVVEWIMARKDDAGVRTLAPYCRINSTDYLGTNTNLADTYALVSKIWELNPNTSAAWSLSEVNSGEWGYKLIA